MCIFYENHKPGYMNKQTVDILLRKNHAKFDSINVPLLIKDHVIQISQEVKALLHLISF